MRQLSECCASLDLPEFPATLVVDGDDCEELKNDASVLAKLRIHGCPHFGRKPNMSRYGIHISNQGRDTEYDSSRG